MFIMIGMFDDEDSFGIIKAILESGYITVVVDGRVVKVDPHTIVRRLEVGVAKWLIENNDVLIPRQELVKITDIAFRERVCGSNASCNYTIHGEGDKKVSLDEALDSLLLNRSNIYQVYAGTYILLPLDAKFWQNRDSQRLWHFLNIASKLVELFVADRLGIVISYGDLVRKIGEAYCRLFLGMMCENPLGLYHKELAKFYGISDQHA